MWWWWCVLRENVIVGLIIYQSERGAALPLLWITSTRRCSWTAQSLWTTTQSGSSDISYIRQGWIEGQPSCLLRGSLGISWETRRKPVLLSADLRACMKENFHDNSHTDAPQDWEWSFEASWENYWVVLPISGGPGSQSRHWQVGELGMTNTLRL